MLLRRVGLVCCEFLDAPLQRYLLNLRRRTFDAQHHDFAFLKALHALGGTTAHERLPKLVRVEPCGKALGDRTVGGDGQNKRQWRAVNGEPTQDRAFGRVQDIDGY